MPRLHAMLLKAAGLLLALTTAVAAQDYPNKPVRLIIPFPPGGSNDVVGRLIATHLGERLGKQVVVDNRAGAGGVVGTELAANAPPDGYTIQIVSIAHAVNPWLYKLPYDPIKSFTPISILASGPNVVTVHPSLPVNSIKDLVALAKQKPGELQYASAGVGSFQHLGGELFKLEAGVNMLHVPFKGGGPAMIDVIGGHTKVLFSSLVQTTPAHPLRQAQGARRRRQQAQPGPSRCPDRGGGRCADLRSRQLVGPCGPRRHTRVHHRAAAQGSAGGADLPRGAEAVRIRGRGDRADEPGRVRCLHGEGNDQMGARGEGGRHQGGVT
jgi:hypothetical protein